MNLQQRSGLAGAMGRGAQLSLFGGAADAHGDPGPATRRSWEVFQSEGHPKMLLLRVVFAESNHVLMILIPASCQLMTGKKL